MERLKISKPAERITTFDVEDKGLYIHGSLKKPGAFDTYRPLLNGEDKITVFPPRRHGVDIVNDLVMLLLSVRVDLTHPFAIKAYLTQTPQNVYPRLSIPRQLSLVPN